MDKGLIDNKYLVGMHVLFISPECYPAAKVGGLGDVVGALPKYLEKAGVGASVIMPMYANAWIMARKTEEVFKGAFLMGDEWIDYCIMRPTDVRMGYNLHFVHIPGKFDRPGVYMDPVYGVYGDENRRSIAFQRAVLDWVKGWWFKPDIIHCHDHHAGLVPFMMKYCPEYGSLAGVPTVFTIHNAAYQGVTGWDYARFLPFFQPHAGGMIEWGGDINRLAAGIRNAYAVTTVSNGYLESLLHHGFGLESLISQTWNRSFGILNGIDDEVWDPRTDEFLDVPMKRSWKTFKRKNKKGLTDQFDLDPELPLFVFIGRLVNDKGADMLPGMISTFIERGGRANFILLGSGVPGIEEGLRQLEYAHPEMIRTLITYDEQLSHRLYGGLDFLLMPSRTEPCGLNQMYTMRYGGIPMVVPTGGLRDTVKPMREANGNGFWMEHWDFGYMASDIQRAVDLYNDEELRWEVVKRNTQVDFSWNRSAQVYIDLYEELKPQ